ncbi:glycoside hydrolase family 5 protein [Apiosordaria backusii]|uniref:Glycoside hydrolase family 5 protein n=1 Tax=Apiosordaria backusii TaxID=314023 RepID=A0AA40K3I2_9PEZI|nr:glycoside hydrolase family 5 protein [Apiosordaria backusii]
MKLLSTILALASFTIAAPGPQPQPQDDLSSRQAGSWPFGPFVTSAGKIRDTTGKSIVYAGTNWPGHGEVMIPEGLQYQSIEYIVTKIKSIGMNAIRLTFAIEMIDQIYANNGQDITIERAFIQALGQANGTRILNQVLTKNPQFTASTTRLQVFDAVAAELAKQQIYVHLDNHISKGMWCCSGNDGNTWWGDTHFNTANWVRGLSYMANHGRNWTGLVSLGLRNEPREPTSNPTLGSQSYNWQSLYNFHKQGSLAVNKANPSLLIFLSGLNYDTTVAPFFDGSTLSPGNTRFSLGDFSGYANKLVLEIHNYETGINSCSSLQYNLFNKGFKAMTAEAKIQFPVLLTEFGFAMDASTWRGTYATCLASYLPAQKAGWTIWVLAGSYYVREGRQDYDEGW